MCGDFYRPLLFRASVECRRSVQCRPYWAIIIVSSLHYVIVILFHRRRVRQYLRQPDVDRQPVVVQRGRLQNYPRRSHGHGQCEYPQEQPVQHHRDVFPIFFDLKNVRLDYDRRLCYRLRRRACGFNPVRRWRLLTFTFFSSSSFFM